MSGVVAAVVVDGAGVQTMQKAYQDDGQAMGRMPFRAMACESVTS